MSKRDHISFKTKLAAALLQMLRPDEDGKLVPVIPYADAKLMTADQIISLFHFDHYPIRKADGGADEPWNLTPRPITEHREKTAKKDKPELAKSARLRGETGRGRKQAIPSRPFSKDHRPLRSRNTFQRSAS